MKKRKLIIAVDFDGTIVDNNYPNIGKLKPHVREIINSLHDEFNIATILWTCRSGKELQDTIQYLTINDIHFDQINDDLDWVKQSWENSSRKIFADIYIDDKNLDSEINWENIFDKVIEFKYLNNKSFI